MYRSSLTRLQCEAILCDFMPIPEHETDLLPIAFILRQDLLGDPMNYLNRVNTLFRSMLDHPNQDAMVGFSLVLLDKFIPYISHTVMRDVALFFDKHWRGNPNISTKKMEYYGYCYDENEQFIGG